MSFAKFLRTNFLQNTSGRLFLHVGAVQDIARPCTGIWDACCIFSCLMFLTVNNETVTHYLGIIYVAVERANLFSKVAWVYILYHDNVLVTSKTWTQTLDPEKPGP